MTDEVRRRATFSAEPAAVWQAITEPGRLAGWLAEEASLELRPGGEAAFLIDGRRRHGWVEEVRPPRRSEAGVLAFWWQADGEPASRVQITVAADAGGTRLELVEARPLDVLDLVGIPLAGGGAAGASGGARGPALVAA